MPPLFQWQWPNDICAKLISHENPNGIITNSDLEMVGLLLLWLTMEVEGVCGPLQEICVAMFGDNSPLIGWVQCLASKRSLVAKHLIQALTLQLKIQRACPLTTIYIVGKRNTISDVPSRLFGSNPAWQCANSDELLTLFNPMFPLPNQTPWTVFHLNCKVVTHVASALLTKPFALDDWRQLLKKGRHVGKIGVPVSNLWEWIHTLTTHPSKPECAALPVLHSKQEQDSMDSDNRSKVAQYLK